MNAKSASFTALLALLCGAWLRPAAAEESEPELWFPVGEVLTYSVHWGILSVGSAQMTTEWLDEDGRRLLAIRMRVKSNRFLSAIYPVDDFTESLIDPKTFLPVRFTQKLKEGRHSTDEVTQFDHESGQAHWKSFIKNREKQYGIEKDTRDLLSFMYFLRGQAEYFKPGASREFKVMTDEKLYELFLQPLKNEKISLSGYGPIPSVRFEPEAKFKGLFVRKGKVWLWVSDDPRRIITKLVASIPVASVRILLNEVSGPGDDGWVRGNNRQKKSAASEDDLESRVQSEFGPDPGA